MLDDRDVPQGWLSTVSPPPGQGVTPGLLDLGGTLAMTSGSLREILDAALSSPSGRGVVTHPDGRFAGTVSPSQVLALIEERAAHIRETAPHHALSPGADVPAPAMSAQRRPQQP